MLVDYTIFGDFADMSVSTKQNRLYEQFINVENANEGETFSPFHKD